MRSSQFVYLLLARITPLYISAVDMEVGVLSIVGNPGCSPINDQITSFPRNGGHSPSGGHSW